ncbi:FecR family protein [Skermanella rosea]|uniref:FecR family protein n=1 Tax=Skermanella rosea TaxID=1817965 RepID=UPI0019315FB8|nr:FecR family protein [Skermanella rosea]UEM01259.1 FecR family protein [Skermanella rosea]
MGIAGRIPPMLLAGLMMASSASAADMTPADRAPVGRVVRQEGSTVILRDDIRSPLLIGTSVFTSDVIETGFSSRVTVQFRDGSSLVTGPESRVQVSDYTIDPQGGRTSALFSMLSGIVRAVVGQAGLGSFAVQTDTAVASARSTEWTAEITPAGTAVLGLEGVVEVRSRSTGAAVTLAPSQGTDVAAGRDPTPPVTWGAPRVDRTLRLVGPANR